MTIFKVGLYHPEDSMSDLICENYPMLLVMSRFGIDLGFGEGSIEEVCRKHNVDLYTFLAVVNTLVAQPGGKGPKIDYAQISLRSLICYLHESHAYFLEYRLPTIRRELVEALEGSGDVAVVILNYFDEYVAEVNKHMMYEEETLFPYINSMLNDTFREAYSIDIYSQHHDKVEAKLSEFKSILIKYYPAKTTYALNNVLYDIFSCERDLASHNCIEDELLVPTMRAFESMKGGKNV
ncbi:MAG: hemerythrin domain-containing protein [Rikenellaceae bacterium]